MIKIKRFIYLLFVLGFSACGDQYLRVLMTATPQPPIPTVGIASSTFSVQPTDKAFSKPVPSETTILFPTMITPRPDPTITATRNILTITPPSHIPTIIPTLSQPTMQPDQTNTYVRTMMREPVDCDAPCLWGVTPEKTSRSEVERIYSQLGLRWNIIEADNSEFYDIDYQIEKGFEISQSLRVQNDVVKNIRLYINSDDQPGKTRQWLTYSPETLIKRYGYPSKINLYVVFGRGMVKYALEMYFEAVNLIVQYALHPFDESLQVCPLTDKYEQVRLWFGRDPIYPPDGDFPLSEVSSLTIESFSRLMLGNPHKACFTIDLKRFLPPNK